MALGIQTESTAGDFTPIMKYDAKAGRFFRVDRTQDSAGNWQTDNVEITNGIAFILDFATIEVGWINFNAGSAPDFRLVPLGQPLPAKPGDNYKQGFRSRIKLAKSCGGDVREWAHTAKIVLGQVDGLHSAYLAAPESKQGKLPVIQCHGTVPVKTGSGAKSSTNYQPQIFIASWIDRPADMPLKNGNGATPASAQPARTLAATHVPPPVQETPKTAPLVAGAEF